MVEPPFPEEEISVQVVPLLVDNSIQKLSYEEPSRSNSRRVCITEPAVVCDKSTSLTIIPWALLL